MCRGWKSNRWSIKGMDSTYNLLYDVIQFEYILQNIPGCLIPYLVEQIISVTGSIGSLIYIAYKSQTNPSDIDNFFAEFILDDIDPDNIKNIIIIAIVIVVILTVEGIYSWIVIFALYQQMTNLSHKVQDSIILDNYPHHQNLSIDKYPSNASLVLGNYPPPTHLTMSHYPSNLNVGINSYPSIPNQNQSGKAPDGLGFTYN